MAEYANERVRCSEGSRSRAYRSEQGGSEGDRREPRETEGNRRKPDDIEGQTEAGGSPSSEASPEVTSFAYASAWRAAVEAIFECESDRGG